MTGGFLPAIFAFDPKTETRADKDNRRTACKRPLDYACFRAGWDQKNDRAQFSLVDAFIDPTIPNLAVGWIAKDIAPLP